MPVACVASVIEELSQAEVPGIVRSALTLGAFQSIHDSAMLSITLLGSGDKSRSYSLLSPACPI